MSGDRETKLTQCAQPTFSVTRLTTFIYSMCGQLVPLHGLLCRYHIFCPIDYSCLKNSIPYQLSRYWNNFPMVYVAILQMQNF